MADDTSVKTQQLEELQEATNRLVRTVDGFKGDDWGGPSGLPGWTRAHVVAHLALNAEGLAGALTGIVQDEPTPMYSSQEDRDSDIEDLATSDPAELRERLLAGCTLYADAWTALPDDSGGATFERTAGGPTIPAGATLGMRLREVEIHHADLDTGYSRADWTPRFCEILLASMTKREWSRAVPGRPHRPRRHLDLRRRRRPDRLRQRRRSGLVADRSRVRRGSHHRPR